MTFGIGPNEPVAENPWWVIYDDKDTGCSHRVRLSTTPERRVVEMSSLPQLQLLGHATINAWTTVRILDFTGDDFPVRAEVELHGVGPGARRAPFLSGTGQTSGDGITFSPADPAQRLLKFPILVQPWVACVAATVLLRFTLDELQDNLSLSFRAVVDGAISCGTPPGLPYREVGNPVGTAPQRYQGDRALHSRRS